MFKFLKKKNNTEKKERNSKKESAGIKYDLEEIKRTKGSQTAWMVAMCKAVEYIYKTYNLIYMDETVGGDVSEHMKYVSNPAYIDVVNQLQEVLKAEKKMTKSKLLPIYYGAVYEPIGFLCSHEYKKPMSMKDHLDCYYDMMTFEEEKELYDFDMPEGKTYEDLKKFAYEQLTMIHTCMRSSFEQAQYINYGLIYASFATALYKSYHLNLEDLRAFVMKNEMIRPYVSMLDRIQETKKES